LINLTKEAQVRAMGKQVNLYEAKTHLSQLVEDAARGEELA